MLLCLGYGVLQKGIKLLERGSSVVVCRPCFTVSISSYGVDGSMSEIPLRWIANTAWGAPIEGAGVSVRLVEIRGGQVRVW